MPRINESAGRRSPRPEAELETTKTTEPSGIRALAVRAWETNVFGTRFWQDFGWWLLALATLSGAMLLIHANPAFAQSSDINTCNAGNVGGEGGQQILNGIRNLALFAAATVGSISVLGLIGSGLAIILGSANKDWQRRGVTGLGYTAIGVAVALSAAALYGVISWAFCQGA
ncbi:MAG: hypothetical protein ACFB50_08275 [Rubrobacteraceae bacterium]